MSNILKFIISGFLLTACTTAADYQATLNTWMGHDITTLTNSWGYPTRSFQAPNGNTVYVWQGSSSITLPSNTTTTYQAIGNTVQANSTTTQGENLNFYCETMFEVNSDNRIIKWTYSGNRCY